MSILSEIVEHKRAELAESQRSLPADELADRALAVGRPVRSLAAALRTGEPPRIVAEIKRRSPSRGEIRADFEPLSIAKAYADAGAAAISVLTDERYFGGHLDVLREVRAVVDLPLLRKDFVIDAYQVDEARLAGADAVLLIVAALAPAQLGALRAYAEALGLEALVEVHDEAELDVALAQGARLIGINNRDLATFEVDLATTERLAPRAAREALVVAESGIGTGADLRRLEAAGAHAFLVGESLMRAADPGAALRALREAR